MGVTDGWTARRLERESMALKRREGGAVPPKCTFMCVLEGTRLCNTEEGK